MVIKEGLHPLFLVMLVFFFFVILYVNNRKVHRCLGITIHKASFKEYVWDRYTYQHKTFVSKLGTV
jgi:hypothetical protein